MNSNEQKPLALVSCTDKAGLEVFIPKLIKLGYDILSTGGTAKFLTQAGILVTDVATYTGQEEFLGGRVKTLHPKVHGGILCDRNNPEHLAEMDLYGARLIDLVVVNLYNFSENSQGVPPEKAIEFIDIGGPTMLRAAAKNYQHCLAVIDPSDYDELADSLCNKALSTFQRLRFSSKVFASLASYNQAISQYLMKAAQLAGAEGIPDYLPSAVDLKQVLRYGENPHQKAGFYTAKNSEGVFAAHTIHQGKPLSYNNVIDLDAAISLAKDLTLPGVAIIKHTNPCGVSSHENASVETLFKQALAADPQSAFGGIVAVNRPVDEAAAMAMVELFVECIAAPSFTAEALKVFSNKRNLRVMSASFAPDKHTDFAIRSVSGGFLLQNCDMEKPNHSCLETVGKSQLKDTQGEDLVLAMTICKHVKSNAIVFVKGGVTVAVGAGQMSRIDAVKCAVEKAKSLNRDLRGSVLASDGFFPFGDSVEFAAGIGVAAIIQPGGSKRDQESIDAADANNIPMVFTGKRHFRH